MEPTTVKYSQVATQFKHSVTDEIRDVTDEIIGSILKLEDEQAFLKDAYTHLQDSYANQQVKLNLAMGISVTSLVTGVVSLIIGLL